MQKLNLPYLPRQILGIGIGIPAVLSLLTPFLVTSLKAMIVIRFLQGFFAGMTFPCIQGIKDEK